MSKYLLLFDRKFSQIYRKLDRSIQIEGDKKLLKLKESPKDIGKPLKFFPNFFELYLQSYRIYYVVEEKESKVLVLALKHKDEQDKFLRNLTLEQIRKSLMENS